MRFTKDIEYALISMVAMVGGEEITSARDISERYAVPYERLSKILQRLARADILESVQGAHGGYRLLVSPESVTLGDIIDAVHQKRRAAPCLDKDPCVRADVCNIKGSIRNVQSMWERMVASITLARFAQLDEQQMHMSAHAIAKDGT